MFKQTKLNKYPKCSKFFSETVPETKVRTFNTSFITRCCHSLINKISAFKKCLSLPADLPLFHFAGGKNEERKITKPFHIIGAPMQIS